MTFCKVFIFSKIPFFTDSSCQLLYIQFSDAHIKIFLLNKSNFNYFQVLLGDIYVSFLFRRLDVFNFKNFCKCSYRRKLTSNTAILTRHPCLMEISIFLTKQFKNQYSKFNDAHLLLSNKPSFQFQGFTSLQIRIVFNKLS